MPDVKGLINDPEFQKLDMATQKGTLGKLDSEFSTLSDGDFVKFRAGMMRNPAEKALNNTPFFQRSHTAVEALRKGKFKDAAGNAMAAGYELVKPEVETIGMMEGGRGMISAGKALAAGSAKPALGIATALATGYGVDRSLQAIGITNPYIREGAAMAAGAYVGGKVGLPPETIEKIKESGGPAGFLRKLIKGPTTADKAADFYAFVHGNKPVGEIELAKAKVQHRLYQKRYEQGGDDAAAKFIEEIKTGFKGAPLKEPKIGKEPVRKPAPGPGALAQKAQARREAREAAEATEAKPEKRTPAPGPGALARKAQAEREAREAKEAAETAAETAGGEGESAPKPNVKAAGGKQPGEEANTPADATGARYTSTSKREQGSSREIDLGAVAEKQAKVKDAALADHFKSQGITKESLRSMTEEEYKKHLAIVNAKRRAQGLGTFGSPRPGTGKSRTLEETLFDISRRL